MKNFLVIISLSFSLLLACNSAKNVNTDNGYFGESFKVKNPMEVDKLVVQLSSTDSVEAQVIGKVESVCLKKGCWMNIATEQGNEIFVKFKDYGFFMPLDLAGKEVIMNGKAYKDVTPVDELRHYAEDAGKSPEEIAAITEPEEELKFMATGVFAPDYKK